ncbi:MAG: glycosyltransferase [Chloroflexi bacterium]|nr:glycosyltransferase [Chloroflexota bacterium]
MKVLMVHNFYQHPGGEDKVFELEVNLLRRNAMDVKTYTAFNKEISGISKFQVGLNAFWSRKTIQEISSLLHTEKPDIVHIHNLFPLVSPSIYFACSAVGVPVIQTLHNFRLICPVATLFRAGRVCHDCVERVFDWPSIKHACYRSSRLETSAVAGMNFTHKLLGTWRSRVDRYIALTNFAKELFIKGGLPADKIVVKPNFVHPDPGVGNSNRLYALYVGRLSPEKGLDLLLSAWKDLKHIPLKIVGDGPMMDNIQTIISKERLENVEILGRLPSDEVIKLMKGSRFLVIPSRWYEGFPMTLVEAFACGTPVVASRLGGLNEIIEDQKTGIHFSPGDPQDLQSKVTWAWNQPDKLEEIGHYSRKAFEVKYSEEVNFQALINIYESALS